MDERRFLSLLRKARTHSYLGGSPDYWHGYQHGLRRGFLGELFGTDDEHKHWMRLADDGSDKASRERGRGYRDGLSACGVAADGSPLAGSTRRRGRDLESQANRVNPNRR
jgi:hypothetical protein